MTAAHWRDPGSYELEHTDLFPAVGIVEDPHLYLDADGRFHALFHHEIGCPPKSWTTRNINCGGHAYSEDGRRWFYGSAAGGRANGTAYWQNASLHGGGVLHFGARQRPHMVLGPDGATPVAVTNGAQAVGATAAGQLGAGGDASWTFLQQLATGS